MIELIGGPDRDRTDDLFHVISHSNVNLLISQGSVRPLRPFYPPIFTFVFPDCSLKEHARPEMMTRFRR
jgi:hypothetical protein